MRSKFGSLKVTRFEKREDLSLLSSPRSPCDRHGSVVAEEQSCALSLIFSNESAIYTGITNASQVAIELAPRWRVTDKVYAAFVEGASREGISNDDKWN